MWKSIGKWVGKGIVWLIRHPEALETAVEAIKAAKAKKDDKPGSGSVN